MAEMNLRDYAETAKIAAVIGGVGLVGFLAYRFFTSGITGKLSNLAVDAYDWTADQTEFAAKVAGQWWNGEGGIDAGGASGRAMSNWAMIFKGNYQDTKGVEATSAYIVIRKRDFDSQWKMSGLAYKAAVDMHKDNKTILEKFVLDGQKLKKAFQQLVKTADFVIIYPDGSFKSA